MEKNDNIIFNETIPNEILNSLKSNLYLENAERHFCCSLLESRVDFEHKNLTKVHVKYSDLEYSNEIQRKLEEKYGDVLNIYYVRISRNEDESINLNLCVKNKFNKNIIVESKDVSVNGIDTNPKFSISVLAGEKSFDKMVFNTDIAELVNLKCIFVIKDENTNEVLEECSIDIFKED